MKKLQSIKNILLNFNWSTKKIWKHKLEVTTPNKHMNFSKINSQKAKCVMI